MTRTFTYQWQRNTGSWGDIAAATSKNYTPVVADYGYPLRLGVTPSDGSTPAYSNATNAVSSPLVQAILALPSLASYWALDDLSGTTAVNKVSATLNGSTSGATVNQNINDNIMKAYSLDGVNDYVDVYSAAFNTAFLPSRGTAFAFINGTNLNNVTTRRVFFWSAAGSNFASITKTSTANTLAWQYVANGTSKTVTTGGFSSATWYFMALTWDTGADEVKAFINGTQSGSTQTGLGVWVGALASTTTVIGSSNNSGSQPWEGYLAHVAYCNTALSAATLLSLAQLGGVA